MLCISIEVSMLTFWAKLTAMLVTRDVARRVVSQTLQQTATFFDFQNDL